MWKLICVILICCIFILGVIKVIHMIKNKKQNSTYSIVLFSISLITITTVFLLICFDAIKNTSIYPRNTSPKNADPFTYPIVKGGLQLDVQKINPVKKRKKRSNTGLGKDIDLFLSEIKEAEFGLNKSPEQPHSHWVKQGNNIIILEHITPDFVNHVGNIIFIPNQELLNKVDEKLLLQPGYINIVLCKSTYAYEVFKNFKNNNRCTWRLDVFTFPPLLNTRFFTQPKDRHIYFHPAGKSWMKHTSRVVEAWLRNPQWPKLIVTCKYHCASNHRESLNKIQDAPNITWSDFLPASEMKSLQMHAGVVIMPSACEGFGHSIYETMENGNLLIASDVPPINENLVDGVDSLLISQISAEAIGDTSSKFKWLHSLSKRAGQSGSACFDISIEGIEKAVERSLKLSDEEYDKIRLNAVKKVYQLAVDGKESVKAALQRSGFVLNKKDELNIDIDTNPDIVLGKNSRVIYYLGAVGQINDEQIKDYFSTFANRSSSGITELETEPIKEFSKIPRSEYSKQDWFRLGDKDQKKDLVKLLRDNNFRENVPIFSVLGDFGPNTTDPTDGRSKNTHPLELVKNRYDTNIGVVIPVDWERHWGEVDKLASKDIPWSEKQDVCIWRGATTGRPSDRGGNRFALCNRWALIPNTSLVDVGFSKIVQDVKIPPEQLKNEMSVEEMLKYKYIISAPGNDKDSGLQWKLASNSIVLMPKPLTHTWLMESELEPYKHYVPLDDDYKNLIDQLNWCKNNTKKCLEIIKMANKWVEIMKDPDTNREISQAIINEYSRIMASVTSKSDNLEIY